MALRTEARRIPLHCGIVGAAYTNNFGGATQAKLYGIDNALDVLVRQGGINGTPSPNGGQLTICTLAFDITDEVGFDISEQSGTAYASLTPVVSPLDVSSKLLTINLATGEATFVGTIGAAGGPGAFISTSPPLSELQCRSRVRSACLRSALLLPAHYWLCAANRQFRKRVAFGEILMSRWSANRRVLRIWLATGQANGEPVFWDEGGNTNR